MNFPRLALALGPVRLHGLEPLGQFLFLRAVVILEFLLA
jgi:hypothetical protein